MAQLIDKSALVAEINQRIEDYKSHKIDDSYHDGLIFALEDLRDDFINTLEVKEVEEEPVSEEPKYKGGDILYKINDGSKIEIIDIVADQYKFECGDEYPHYEFFGYIEHNYSKNPVSEGLDNAAFDYAEACKYEGGEKLLCVEHFKAGAKWQKRKDEYITEDLGEYISELAKQFPDVSFAKLSRIAVRVAKWQKDRMIGNTTDAQCFGFQGAALFSFRLPADNYLVGSEVKVIVIKED